MAADDYDAIDLTGGTAWMFDFPDDPHSRGLLRDFHETGKGRLGRVPRPAPGLLGATLANGEYLIAGRNVTGFSGRRKIRARADAVRFSLQARLEERGAVYSFAAEPFAPHVVEDGRLVTGQNPASARPVAEAVVKQLG
ncbi:hypothetical protein GS453_21130 [Rhodococcus hoagii]|uniref:Uncharacterized protein n=1 Tax=Rhodococcus hoagii TaxID=43767 RepID=A0AAP2AQN9_RHOHA|nr:hypothetical protein [Prescottella equi]